MGRRVTTGIVGQPSFGKIAINSNTISTTSGVSQANTNLIIDPSGTGTTQVVGNIQLNGDATNGGEVRLADADSSNYVALRAAATIGTNRTLVFPDSVGTSGQLLSTNGSNPATLSWSSPGISVVSDTSSSSAYFPLWTTASSDTSVSTIYRSSTGFSFTPSSGTLAITAATVATITGATTSGTNLVLRSTSNATKGYVYIDETTASTTTSTGALRVGGGVGIGGALNVASASVFSSTIQCTTLTETSSIVFKENVQPLTGALDAVLKLTGVMYDRKDGSYNNETGLIAEDVEKIIPYVVTKNEKGDAHGINYTKLVAYLVESIKSLKEEINELKNR